MAERIAAHLVEKGLGTLGTDLFVGYQPESPDTCVTLYDESGPVADESNAYAIDQHGLQVLVRNPDYRAARDKARAIHGALVAFGGGQLAAAGPEVTFIQIESSPQSLGRDARDRAEWSAHYLVRAESEGDLYRRTA